MKQILTLILTIFLFATSFAQTEKDVYLEFKNSTEYKTILKTLKAKAIYDDLTQVSYIFEAISTDKKVLEVAQQNNIFFALPNKLNVTAKNEMEINLLKKITTNYKRVAKGIFEITTEDNIVSKLFELRKQYPLLTVLPSYYGYFNICGTLNDPLVTAGLSAGTAGSGQDAWLLDQPWILNGKLNPITKDLDSIETWKYMHIESNVANPNVNCI